MPIKGISEVRRLPRIAKIRLGIKVQGKESEYPQRVDWYVCPDNVKAVYGQQPTTLPIMFPSSDPEIIAPQYYKCYRRTYGLVCRGDGESCHAKLDTATGTLADRNTTDWKYEQMTCQGEECPEFQGGNCKRVMSILFVLFELPGLGVYQLDTSNRSSIINANSFIYMLNSMTKGRFAMVPLKMSLLKEERQTPKGKQNISCLVFNKDDIKPIDLLKGIAGQNLLVEGIDEDEPPDDLFPPIVIDSSTVKSAAAAPGAAARTEAAAAPAPPAGKTRRRAKPTKKNPAEALRPPELLESWKNLRTLQKETKVDDAMMRGGFRKAFPEVDIPKAALTDEPPPWVTADMIKNMQERLEQHKKNIEANKKFVDHAFGDQTTSKGQAQSEKETPNSPAGTSKQGVDQASSSEVLDL